MSLVDCEGFLPPDEPDVESIRCVECGGIVWTREESVTPSEAGPLCPACAGVLMPSR